MDNERGASASRTTPIIFNFPFSIYHSSVPPTLSLIIPTHKRADILRECLKRIAAQTVKDQIEVIVVSDGQDDDTDRLFDGHTQYAIRHTQYFSIPKSQQGVARNRGVEKATGEIVMFIGDDIFLEPDACEVHLKVHENMQNEKFEMQNDGSDSRTRTGDGISNFSFPILHSGSAVLGYTEWDPSMEITPVMEWLDRTGWQFGYGFLKPYEHRAIPKRMQHRFTYTSHISLPREIALKFPFREDVTMYGWEDIEWGWRLAQENIPLLYEPDAKAFHHHRMTPEDSLKRMETLGKSAALFESINHDLHLMPKGMKRMAYRFFSLFPTMKGRHARAFLRGIHTAEAPLSS
jgi:glycosyltransferase involved in cell wall biosynthesis